MSLANGVGAGPAREGVTSGAVARKAALFTTGIWGGASATGRKGAAEHAEPDGKVPP